MKTIIAEKPSVAREIARIVGAGKREEGYLTGNGYNVTWAFGHLVQPAMPEEYNLHGFVRSNLPIIPEIFTLVPRQVRTEKGYKADSSVVAQIKIITRLFKDSEQIIVATDAGREGELIFRYLYHYIGCTVPFVRLWISSLTDKAIREGLKHLEDGSRYDNLYHAAKARSEADWLVGINGTQALSIAAGRGTYSVGRVQTPTLAMICERYWENRRFTPEAFWQLHISAKVQDSDGIVKMPSVEKWKDKATATALYNNVKESNTATVVKVERKEKIEETPLLYDLTTLQKDANTKYGFTAEQTLDITQKLYEKKLVTYPRTGSRYIPEDVFAEIPKLLAFIGRLSQWSGKVPQKPEPTRRSVDDSKVTDHHALLVTGEKPLFLSEDESKVYHLIAGRMIEAFRKMREGRDSCYGGMFRRGVLNQRSCSETGRMACRLQGRTGRDDTSGLERRGTAAPKRLFHDGRKDQAQAPPYGSHPALGDGNGRQGNRGRGTASGTEGLRYRNPRHPCLRH